jgi:hypothetical protein
MRDVLGEHRFSETLRCDYDGMRAASGMSNHRFRLPRDRFWWTISGQFQSKSAMDLKRPEHACDCRPNDERLCGRPESARPTREQEAHRWFWSSTCEGEVKGRNRQEGRNRQGGSAVVLLEAAIRPPFVLLVGVRRYQ